MAKQKVKKQVKPKAHKARRRVRRIRPVESDSTYLLKLVIFIILGTLWLKFNTPVEWLGLHFNGLPLGLMVGLLVVHNYEKNVEDRKIWYACLLVIAIISYFVPAGIVI